MSVGLRRYRGALFTYSDQGDSGVIASTYTQVPSEDIDGNWWLGRAQPSGRELTIAQKAGHGVDAVFHCPDYLPVDDHSVIVSDGVAYLVRAVLDRLNGHQERALLCERTTDPLALIGIPVMLVEGPLPIAFFGVEGEDDPDDITRDIDNIGASPLPLPTLTVPPSSWLTTATVSGTSAPYTLSLGVTMGDLQAGVYTIDGTLSAPGAVSQPVHIVLTIQATPTIGLTPSAFAPFSGEVGGDPSDEQTVAVADPGGVTLTNLHISDVSDGWIVADLTGGVLTVSCDPGVLALGAYTGAVELAADNAPSVVVPVTFSVNAPVQSVIELTPSSLAFTGTAGGAVTPTQTMAVADAAGVGLVNVDVGNVSAAWLHVSIVGATISVFCDPAAETPNNLTGSFDVTADNAATVTVAVTFDVDAAPVITIALDPSSLGFAGTAGGPVTATKTVAVSGNGGALVSPAVGNASAAWIQASIVGNTISVSCDPAAESAGQKSGTVEVSAANAPTVLLPVSFNVAAAPTVALALSQSAVAVSGVIGGPNPSMVTVTINPSPTGGKPLAGPVRGTITYPTGDSGWLTAIVTGTGPTYTLSLSFDTTGITAPTSRAVVPISDSAASNSPVSCTVTLTMTAAPIPPPPGTYAPPLYTIPDWLTHNSATNQFSGNPITAAGFTDPDCDPSSPTFSYGPTGTFNPGVAQIRQFTTLAQLAALAPVCVRGDILELTADITTASVFDLPKHLQDALANGWVLLRGNVAPACSESELRPPKSAFAACRTITYTGNPAYFWRFAAGANKWHLRHLVLRNGSNAEQFGLFKHGTEPDATTTTAAPVGLKMKHCLIDGNWNNTNRFCGRAMLLQGSVCDFYGVRAEGCAYNGHSDSQGVLVLSSLGDIRWLGGKCEGASENVNFGGGRQSLGTRAYAKNVWFDQVDLSKRAEWMSPGAGGSTAYTQIKCHLEFKCGVQAVFSNCYFGNNNGAGSHDVRVKVSPYSSAEVTYLQTRDITLWNCYGTNGCGGAMEISSGDSHAPLPSTALPVLRIQVHNSAFINPRNNTFSGGGITISNVKRHHIGGLADALHQLANVAFTHCGFSLNEQCILFTPPPAMCVPGFRYRDCINYSAVQYRHISSAGGGDNIAALQKYCGQGPAPGTWEMAGNVGVHNAGAADFYQGLESAPYSNLCFTSAGTPGTGSPGSGPLGAELNADYTVKSASVLYHSATDSTLAVPRDKGPDWSQLQLAMAAHD